MKPNWLKTFKKYQWRLFDKTPDIFIIIILNLFNHGGLFSNLFFKVRNKC